MPRANIVASEAWRAEFAAERLSDEAQRERWIQVWTLVVTICAGLFIMIHNTPYSHVVVLDEETGGAQVSPVNRFIWIGLTLMSLPILYARRTTLIETLKSQWLLLVLYAWFSCTVLWSLDPSAASRRLFLYILNLVIAIAVVRGFDTPARLHRGFAIACSIITLIDFFSWILLPGSITQTEIGLAVIHNHKNQLGLVMMFSCLVIGPYFFAQKTSLGRWYWGCNFLAAFALLHASKSKTSEGIVVAALALTPLLMLLLKARIQSIMAVLGAIVMIPFVGALFWLVYAMSMGQDPFAPFAGITFTQRTDVWAFVISEIAKRPFTGSGFGSFWDINPLLQPSLQGDLWFGSPALANEAHNGYLDLFVTTGIFGLIGSLAVLFGWIGRSQAVLRRTLISTDPAEQDQWPEAVMLALFPLLIFVHNFMESSYFTANQTFGSLILFIGVCIDLNHARGRSAARAISGPFYENHQKPRHHAYL
jgi:O-antigen ligase